VPSLRDIRTRIGSVKNTRQITKAMKMVSAAKLRRAQESITRARPYATLLEQALARVAARAAADDQVSHPLLAARPVRAAELVLLTSDRGLAGAFNSNVIRRSQRFLTETSDQYERVDVSILGRKARDFFRARHTAVRKDYGGVHQLAGYEKALELADELSGRFLAGEVDAVFLCYNEFKSAIAQTVVVKQLLPIVTAGEATTTGFDFIYEPSRDQLLAELVPKHLAFQVWRALLDSVASEHGARMTAMAAATSNAEDMIAALTLQYNRARQAYVTKELMEIVSGAEALK